MTLRGTIEDAWTHNRLVSALIELTYACNLNCSFCYNDLGLQGKPLTLAQYRDLLDDLAAQNTLYLILTGGEPLSHPEFFTIGSYAKQLGFVTRIKTNGHSVNAKVAKRIKSEVDPYRLEVSLHGASAEVHDRQTRVDGSFARLMNNFEAMRDAGLRVQVNTALTRWNEHQIADIFSIVDRLGFRIQVDDEVKPRDDGDASPTEIQASTAGLAELRRLQMAYGTPREAPSQTSTIETQRGETQSSESQGNEPEEADERRGDKHCGAGASTLAIDPVGNVLPCVQWRMPVGNLHEARLRDIWNNQALGSVRDTTREIKQTLSAYGDDAKQLRFCPGLAHSNSGNPRAVYSSARKRADGRLQLPVLL